MEDDQQESGPSHSHEPLSNRGKGKKHKHAVAKLKQSVLPGVKATLVLSLILYLALLIVGALGVKRCPLEDNIPLFLIATGAVGMVAKVVSIGRNKVKNHLQVKYIETSFYAVEIVFFILGSYWVYKEYPANYDPNNGKPYCQKTVYMFAFVYLTFAYAVAVTIFAGFICFLICICFLQSVEAADDADAEAQMNAEESEQRQRTTE